MQHNRWTEPLYGLGSNHTSDEIDIQQDTLQGTGDLGDLSFDDVFPQDVQHVQQQQTHSSNTNDVIDVECEELIAVEHEIARQNQQVNVVAIPGAVHDVNKGVVEEFATSQSLANSIPNIDGGVEPDTESQQKSNDVQCTKSTEPIAGSPRNSSVANASKEKDTKLKPRIGPDSFDLLCTIGKGGYGRVLQVRERTMNKVYAMKVLQKENIVKKKNTSYVREERNILTVMDHPFVVKLFFAFQSEEKLFLVMEYLSGGELFHHIRQEGLFMEKEAMFYSAEILLALEYLHARNIVHRDLKPENVLLDSHGHVRLTDFGLAKATSEDEQSTTRLNTICGTDLYMAPEMLAGTGYGKAVDWWSLGTLMFEMLTGDTPFYAKDSKSLYKKIMSQKPKYPKWLTSQCHSLLKGLLNRNVELRLGAAKSTMFKTRGVQELKDHAFFKTMNWKKLVAKELTPPLIPKVSCDEDTSNFDEKFTKVRPDQLMQAEDFMADPEDSAAPKANKKNKGGKDKGNNNKGQKNKNRPKQEAKPLPPIVNVVIPSTAAQAPISVEVPKQVVTNMEDEFAGFSFVHPSCLSPLGRAATLESQQAGFEAVSISSSSVLSPVNDSSFSNGQIDKDAGEQCTNEPVNDSSDTKHQLAGVIPSPTQNNGNLARVQVNNEETELGSQDLGVPGTQPSDCSNSGIQCDEKVVQIPKLNPSAQEWVPPWMK